MSRGKFSTEAKRRRLLKAHAERLRTISGDQLPNRADLKKWLYDDRVPIGSKVVTAWDEAARWALTLHEGREYLDRIDNPKMREIGERLFPDPDAALRRAFEHYHLDPVDPLSWKILLDYYATVQFGRPPRRPGRRKTTMDKRKLKQAAEAAREKLRSKHSRARISNALVAQELAKDPRYKSIGVHGLRKRLGRPAKN
jgi:hypothetical protein